MAFPSNPNARTEQAKVSFQTQPVTVQEFPALPALRFSRFLTGTLKVLDDAARREEGRSLHKLEFFVPATDEHGAPIYEDGPDTLDENGVPLPAKQQRNFNVTLLAKLLNSVAEYLEEKWADLIELLEAACVSPTLGSRTRVLTPEISEQLLFGDVIAMITAVVKVNVHQDSSLGNVIRGRFGKTPEPESKAESQPQPGLQPAPTPVPTFPPTSQPQ